MEQRGEFPRRFALSPRCIVWDLGEVEAWLAFAAATLDLAQIAPGAGLGRIYRQAFRDPMGFGKTRSRFSDQRRRPEAIRSLLSLSRRNSNDLTPDSRCLPKADAA